MGYQPPAFEQLMLDFSYLKNNYYPKNEDRKKLFTMLDDIYNYVISSNKIDTKLEEVWLGACIFVLIDIEQSYYWLNPSYQPGYLCNTGSKLFTKLKNYLNVNEENPLSNEEKIIYLISFHEFLSHSQLLENVAQKNLIEKINNLLKNLFSNLDLDNIISSYEKSKQEKQQETHDLSTYEKYRIEKTRQFYPFFSSVNPEREFEAQLIDAITTLYNSDYAEKFSEVTRKRVKIGVYLATTSIIHQETSYYRSYSPLYHICHTNLPELDISQKLDALTAFKYALNDPEFLNGIEEFGLSQVQKNCYATNHLVNIPSKIYKLQAKLDPIIADLFKSMLSNQWPITHFCAEAGALVLAAPAFGVGVLGGFAIASNAIATKVILGHTINKLAVIVIGSPGGLAGLIVADALLTAILTRALGKVSEAVGKLLGKIGGGSIGFVVEYSCNGLINFCNYGLSLRQEVPSTTENVIQFKLIEKLKYYATVMQIASDKNLINDESTILLLEDESNAEKIKPQSYQISY